MLHRWSTRLCRMCQSLPVMPIADPGWQVHDPHSLRSLSSLDVVNFMASWNRVWCAVQLQEASWSLGWKALQLSKPLAPLRGRLKPFTAGPGRSCGQGPSMKTGSGPASWWPGRQSCRLLLDSNLGLFIRSSRCEATLMQEILLGYQGTQASLQERTQTSDACGNTLHSP